MTEFDPQVLKQLYVPDSSSHKAQNGKVMLIAGSKLFHAASIWPLTVISRIVDMTFYASVSDNNEIVSKMKEQFLNGIVIPREKIDDYTDKWKIRPENLERYLSGKRLKKFILVPVAYSEPPLCAET